MQKLLIFSLLIVTCLTVAGVHIGPSHGLVRLSISHATHHQHRRSWPCLLYTSRCV